MSNDKTAPETQNKASPQEEDAPISTLYDTFYQENFTSKNAASVNEIKPDIETRNTKNTRFDLNNDFSSSPTITRESYKKHIITDEDFDLDDEL